MKKIKVCLLAVLIMTLLSSTAIFASASVVGTEVPARVKLTDIDKTLTPIYGDMFAYDNYNGAPGYVFQNGEDGTDKDGFTTFTANTSLSWFYYNYAIDITKPFIIYKSWGKNGGDYFSFGIMPELTDPEGAKSLYNRNDGLVNFIRDSGTGGSEVFLKGVEQTKKANAVTYNAGLFKVEYKFDADSIDMFINDALYYSCTDAGFVAEVNAKGSVYFGFKTNKGQQYHTIKDIVANGNTDLITNATPLTDRKIGLRSIGKDFAYTSYHQEGGLADNKKDKGLLIDSNNLDDNFSYLMYNKPIDITTNNVIKIEMQRWAMGAGGIAMSMLPTVKGENTTVMRRDEGLTHIMDAVTAAAEVYEKGAKAANSNIVGYAVGADTWFTFTYIFQPNKITVKINDAVYYTCENAQLLADFAASKTAYFGFFQNHGNGTAIKSITASEAKVGVVQPSPKCEFDKASPSDVVIEANGSEDILSLVGNDITELSYIIDNAAKPKTITIKAEYLIDLANGDKTYIVNGKNVSGEYSLVVKGQKPFTSGNTNFVLDKSATAAVNIAVTGGEVGAVTGNNIAAANYTITTGAVSISGEYLSTLACGAYTFKVEKAADVLFFNVTIIIKDTLGIVNNTLAYNKSDFADLSIAYTGTYESVSGLDAANFTAADNVITIKKSYLNTLDGVKKFSLIGYDGVKLEITINISGSEQVGGWSVADPTKESLKLVDGKVTIVGKPASYNVKFDDLFNDGIYMKFSLSNVTENFSITVHTVNSIAVGSGNGFNIFITKTANGYKMKTLFINDSVVGRAFNEVDIVGDTLEFRIAKYYEQGKPNKNGKYGVVFGQEVSAPGLLELGDMFKDGAYVNTNFAAGSAPTIVIDTIAKSDKIIATNAAKYDFNKANIADVSVTVSNDAVKAVEAEGLAKTDYTFSDGVLKISKSYLAKLSAGEHTFTVYGSYGGCAVFSVAISGELIFGADKLAATLDKALPADIVVVFNSSNNENFSKITGNGITADDYSFTAGALTISNAYLLKFANGEYTFNLIGEYGSSLAFKITISGEQKVAQIIVSNDKQSFNKANPLDLVFTLSEDEYASVSGNDIERNPTFYSYDATAKTLTVKSGYLSALPNGKYIFTVVGASGKSATFSIEVTGRSVDTAPITLSETTYSFDMRDKKDITLSIVTGEFYALSGNGITAEDYTVNGLTIVLKKAFLEKFDVKSLKFELMGAGDNNILEFTVNITNLPSEEKPIDDKKSCNSVMFGGDKIAGSIIMLALILGVIISRKKVKGERNEK